jgi:tRNA-2-methylthio-N6-dimethylallyladenosine synthase
MTNTARKKLYIKTYGCQMNVYDSAKMAELMHPFGFDAVEEPNSADMVILNTCHIREKASEKVYSELGRLRSYKEAKIQNGDNMIIAVAGCTAQAEGEEIFKRAPCVDIVVGPQSYHNLPQLVMDVVRQGKIVIDLDFAPEAKFDFLPEESSATSPVAAFLSIQEGCNEFCKFCVVPYTRGAEFSRPIAEVYREAVRLTNNGTLEITLLGQNVNGYNGLDENNNPSSLSKLLSHLAKIDGVKRLRYTTSHPRHMTDDLIEAHATIDKLMPFLHLPVQSGSNKILRAMNRKHDVEYYLGVIKKLREARPDIGFSSDFIVGYPGETEQDFQETLALVEAVNYAQAYSFKYSPRPGTPASLENQVPEDEKSERLARLQALINAQQFEYNKTFTGQIVPVLFERQGKHDHQIIGRTPYMQSVYVDNSSYSIGTLCDVKLIEAGSHSMIGQV